MLVWLASYPRSGNTLLRQILASCFGLSSCEGLDLAPPTVRDPNKVDALCGSYYVNGGSDEFYTRARESGLVLVKTHSPPRDAEKAIYVIRDGRLALTSFLKYQTAHHPGASTFDALLVGDHAYGDWTGHYRAWQTRPGETLVVRFEELVRAAPALLERIADFLGHRGPLKPWNSPLAALRERDPVNFGVGAPNWVPDPSWAAEQLRAFYTLHGPLLVELGYASEAEVCHGAYRAASAEESRLRHALALAARVRDLQRTCDERLVEIDRLKFACDERLAEIESITREAERRNALLLEATSECARLRSLAASAGGPAT